MVAARGRLLEAGVGRAVIDRLVDRIASLAPIDPAVAVDLGCGSGELLAALADRLPLTGVGLDLSSAATEYAARRHPHLHWGVANADRRLPFADGSVGLVVSLHGRRHPSECARILAPWGALAVAVPAMSDLKELRSVVVGESDQADRVPGVVADHEALFDVVARDTAVERHHLDPQRLQDLLRITYRGQRQREAGRASALAALEVTLASDILLMRPRTVSVTTAAAMTPL